jgi:hypothetical protein
MQEAPPQTTLSTPPPAPPRAELRLTAALRRILEDSSADKPLTLALIIASTGERAFGVLMAFLCLPFLTPLPIPGVSVPFGIALLLLGAQIAIRKHRPWLPARILRYRLPQSFGVRLIGFVVKIFRPLERIIRPRLLYMQNPVAMVFVGIALAIDGFVLSLPLPITFSNAVPAWLALIKILGITEEDGISLLAGTILTLGGAVALVFAALEGWSRLAPHW